MTYFDIIFDAFMRSNAPGEDKARGIAGMATFLGLKRGKIMTWKSGNMPSYEDLVILHRKLGLSCQWLITQEGDPYEANFKREVPLTRLVACGIENWDKVLTPEAFMFPEFSTGMIAVVASGDSLIPAGILSGMVCFCDTRKEPGLGDIVYVERADGLAGLKVYLGAGVPEKHMAKEGAVSFQQWTTAAASWTPQYLDLEAGQIKTLAPVTLIRRNL